MPPTSDRVPQNVAWFSAQFPSARLCRIISRFTGDLLDVQSGLNLTKSEIPRVLLNPESAGVQYWLITPYGDGQALIPIPKDGSHTVRYLTPRSPATKITPTVSPFPVSWVILPSEDAPASNQTLVPYTAQPNGLYEEWDCIITYPHFANNTALLPYLGGSQANHPLHISSFTGQVWFYWTIQFIRMGHEDNRIPPVISRQ